MSEFTNEEIVDLGRRAVECSAWRWLPGMRLRSGYRVVGDTPSGLPVCADESVGGRVPHVRDKGLLPDLSDPATKWLVLELVREAVGAHVTLDAFEMPRGRQFACVGYGVIWDGHACDTEAHALVAALEAVSR